MASDRNSWADRIVGTEDVNPFELMANPANWRIHPREQRDALAGVMDRVGWVQHVIVNVVTQHVLDGHLRIDLAMERGEPSVPVLFVNLSDDEERLMLAALDPLAGMAVTDDAKLRDLVEILTAGDDEAAELLATILDAELPALPQPSTTEDWATAKVAEHRCPGCGHQWTGTCRPGRGSV